ncbi:DUF4157 domain-containing protein [Halomonas sp. LR5S13]|uniref:eCIS core domain-containing protein n=1 Tax=Halomonas rhizosphaerae TaxID=3043296 RepID=UPI0024A7DB7D|nr:DUF4157 domain-containing protein [Halomonas rhizosphaerae]MDI5920401.1 DUF4157 domain-containing protein [Halomonas rhizosphaerae]
MGDVSATIRTKKPARPARTSRVPVRRPAPAVVHRHEAARIQPALKVGAANDPMEHEAEATAERIVTMSAPGHDTAAPPAQGGLSAEARRFPKVDQESQPDTDAFESEPAIPADHQDPDVPSGEDVDTAGLANDEFAEVEAGEPDDPDGAARMAPGEAAATGPQGGDAPASVTRVVAQPGPGGPLPASVRTFMEPRFGVDFSDVRIHDAPSDRRAADRIGARAFTHRHHIWMGQDESVDNRRLMAHELTHVVQQTHRAPVRTPERPEIEGEDSDPSLQRGWVADKAEKIARNVPGYTLLTVILGKSPITGDRVERNAENLIGGFLGLLPGGNLIFERLKETRALERAFEWVSTRLSELNITWSRIKGLVSDFIDEMPAWSPLKIAKRIFQPLVDDIITFISEIKDKILEFIIRGALKLAGPYGEKVWAVIEKVRDVISLILSDPLGFAKNLVRAVVNGFKQLGNNIWQHLKKGLMGWLFGTLQGMEIELPAKLDFKGIINISLQILGLTYASFRKTLVKRLGRGGEKKVAFLEKSVEVVKILVKEGFLGIWQRVLEMIEGFKTTVIDGIRDFVINTIVMGAVSWIAGLSNPVGAIVKVALSIYNMIKTFLERLDQIMEIANSIFSSIGAIAKGKVKDAADFIEKTIAGAIPVFLAFVAAVIPVTGITKTIRTIIKKLQAPVKKAMTKMVTFLVKKAKKLFSKILGKINRKRKLPEAGFVVGTEPHKLKPEKKGNKFTLKIASDTPRPADQVQAEMNSEGKKAADFGDDSTCMNAFEKAFMTEIDEAETALAKVKPEQQKTSTKRTGDKAIAEVKGAGAKLAKLGPCIADNPFLEDEPQDGAIIRAREPRLPEIEGDAGWYADRGKITSQSIDAVSQKAGLGPKGKQRLSNYYENDHIPEKSLGFEVQTYVQGKMNEEIAEGQRDGKAIPDPLLGEIDTRATGKQGQQLPAITIYRPAHRQKTAKDAGRRNHGKIISDASAETAAAGKIARLRAGINAEMQAELENIAGLYSSDPAATKAIRGKIRKGIRALGDLNKTLYGFEPGKAPTIKRGSDGAEGSDLPMGGDPASGLPDFAKLEGAQAIYKAKPKGVGNYLEYDHVVEATLAEKARDLTLSDPAFSGGLEDAVLAGAKVRADTAAADAGSPPEPGTDPVKRARPKTTEQITKDAMARLSGLSGPAFPGKGVAGYNRETAGTVALYRPVHREVTAQQSGIRGSILEGVDLTQAREKLVNWALSVPEDRAQREGAISDLQAGIRKRFTGEIEAHAGHIRDAYQIELKEFMAINRSRQAAAKMCAVNERVGASLRTLRQESLSLIE